MYCQERAHAEYHKLEDLELTAGLTYAFNSIQLRLEFICKKIANNEEVKLEDMIWAEKLSKAIPLLGIVEQSTSSVQWD